MTDVTGDRVTGEPTGTAARTPGTDTKAVRSWTRWGLLVTALLGLLFAQQSVTDDPWPPVLRGVLLVVALGVAAAHVLTSGRALSGSAPVLPGVVALVAAVVAVVAVLVVYPDAVTAWLVPLGVAMSALGMARGWRPGDALVLVAAVVVVAVVLGVLGAPAQTPGPLRPLLAALIAAPIALDVSQFWVWRVVQRLDDARELAAELAATRERARIAAELHDVQGHSLHVIAMRSELVDRLLPDDPATAREHARAVRELAAEALAETRSLVHGYRTGDVAAEVRNAAQVLRAAGAEVTVRGDPAEIPAPAADAFALLVREATTNVLRHSTPDAVEIRVERDAGSVRVAVRNDGVNEPSGGPDGDGGTGVSGLRERFARRGGTVTAGPGDTVGPDTAGWTLSGTIPLGAGRPQADAEGTRG